MNNKTVGCILNEARIAKRISFEQASKDTKIHPNILKKMEADEFSSLGSIYAKSFLKIYSEYLCLDKHDMLAKLENIGPKVESRPILPAGRPVRQSSIKKLQMPCEDKFVNAGEDYSAFIRKFTGVLKKVDFRQVVILLVAIFLIAGFVKFVKNHKRGPEVKNTQVAKDKASKQKSTAKQAVPKDIVKKEAIAKVAAPEKPNNAVVKPKVETAVKKESIVLTLKAKNKNWLQLKVDGRVIFQGILAKGSSETWSANDKFELWLGDAGAVQLEFNGQILDRIGRPGQILKHVVLTRSGLSVKR